MKCYNFVQLGHPAYRCPNKQSSSQGEKKIACVQEEDCSRHSQVSLDSEKGENLMLRRILIKEPTKDEHKKRRALFRVKCKILGKVYRVRIDSGSTDNVISEEAVQKLNLTKILGKNILVNEQVWVEFIIGKYQDRILCDVLPMDACHLLLGRPWQYDREAIHHGKENRCNSRRIQ